MIFLGPLFVSGLMGALFVAYFTRRTTIPYYPVLILALMFPAGLALCSFATFGAYLLQAPHGARLSNFFLTALAFFFIFKIVFDKDSGFRISPFGSITKSWRETRSKYSNLHKVFLCAAFSLWAYILCQKIRSFTGIAFENIIGGGDARFFWNVKAKFFFRAPSEWLNMFSPSLHWTHPDYPLMLPGAVAWGWNFIGKEILVWPMLVSFLFWISAALLVLWYLCWTTHPLSALLGSAFFVTIPCYSFWAACQYADVPAAFFISLSGILLLCGLRMQNQAFFRLAGWFGGCAAWTKNEGLFFIGWLVLITAWMLWKNQHLRVFWKRYASGLILGLILPLMAVFILKKHLAPGGDYLGSGRSLSTYLHMLLADGIKTRIIAQCFAIFMLSFSNWKGLWISFAAASAMPLFLKDLRNSTILLPGILALVILGSYFLILHTSPYDILWQIQTALNRLLLHAGILALLFTFEIFSRILFASELDINSKK